MPVNKNIKNSLPKVASASRKRVAKASGTRLGTLQDWRGVSGKSGKTMSGRRNAFRDGR
jgi:hypothetical protein